MKRAGLIAALVGLAALLLLPVGTDAPPPGGRGATAVEVPPPDEEAPPGARAKDQPAALADGAPLDEALRGLGALPSRLAHPPPAPATPKPAHGDARPTTEAADPGHVALTTARTPRAASAWTQQLAPPPSRTEIHLGGAIVEPDALPRPTTAEAHADGQRTDLPRTLADPAVPDDRTTDDLQLPGLAPDAPVLQATRAPRVASPTWPGPGTDTSR
ncbi:MAG: hypothetical protein R3F60_09150 [bacterium]